MAQLSGVKLFLIAGVAGVIGAISIVLFLSSVEEKYKRAAEPVPENTIRVIVPRQNMRAGDRLTKEALASRTIPEKYAPAHVLLASNVKDVVDRTLLTDIARGRPITQYAVTPTKAKRFSDTVELGKRARSIKVSKVESFDGLLRPGDSIDLMGTFQMQDLLESLGSASPNRGLAQTVSEQAVMPVLENVVVIEAARVDQNGRRYEVSRDKQSRDGIDMEFTLITLALTPTQIARVELAESSGDVFAVLRNIEDTSTAEFDLIETDVLLSRDLPPTENLVIGYDGKPVGRIVGDKIVDKAGNIIGKVVDGRAVDLEGKSLGSIVRDVDPDDPINRVAEVTDVVRDANGNIIGRLVAGKVVDRAGNVIGEVRNGVAVGINGETLGAIDRGVKLDADGNEVDLSGSSVKQDIVLGADGKPVGRVVGDNIIDANGKIVGKVVDGKGVGLDGKPLGRIVKGVDVDDPVMSIAEVADVVRDADGNIIGKIVEGKIVDRSGRIIGEVKGGRAMGLDGQSLGRIEKDVALDRDGNEVDLNKSVLSSRPARMETVVRDASGKLIGKVVDGRLVDSDGNVIGTVDESGVARDLSGAVVGEVEQVVVNAAGEIVGKKAEVVRDADGNVVGTIVGGKVVDKDGNVIGEVDENGDPRTIGGVKLGIVEKAQIVRDSDGNVIGTIVDGKVVDKDGNVIGKVDENGDPVTMDGVKLGTVEVAQIVRDADGSVIGTVVDGKVVDQDGNVIGQLDENGQPVTVGGVKLGTVQEAVVDENGKVLGGADSLGDSVAVVRDANGSVIGKLVDGKVVDSSGKVIGELRGGAVVSNSGEILASGVTIDTTDVISADQALSNFERTAPFERVRVIDFIAGGTGQEGIIPVRKVRLE